MEYKTFNGTKRLPTLYNDVTNAVHYAKKNDVYQRFCRDLRGQ